MNKIIRFVLLFFALLSVLGISAQEEDDIPRVAILTFGELRPFELAWQGTTDLFDAYGFVDGENVEFFFAQSEFDIPTAEIMIEDALANDPDVMILSTTPVAAIGLAMTQEMENPPAIFFNLVTDPYAAGLAQASCVKPDHVTGSQALPPLDLIFPQIADFAPEADTVGIIYNPAEVNSVVSVEWIEEINEDLGYRLVLQTVDQSSTVRATAEAMVMSGVDVFFIPTDSTVTNAIPELSELGVLAGIAVISADVSQVYASATVGIGLDYYQDGVDAARMAIAYLNGELDVARTSVSLQQGLSSAINLDVTSAQNIELPNAIIDNVDFVIENDESTEVPPSLGSRTLEERQELDQTFLDDLYCSNERIAEQQAELED